jgi:phosphohistidine phosphatase
MRLHLLRHAKSSWDDEGLADHDRPLAKRGRRAAQLIADHIREKAMAPDVVLCSSSLRTRETLDRIARSLPPATPVEVEAELYAASAERLLARIRALPDEVGSAMVIGHNPGLQLLALELVGGGGSELARLREKFPTAALATLDLPSGRWSRIAPGEAELVAYVRPRDLGSRG